MIALDFEETTGFQTTSYTMVNTPTAGRYLILTRNASTSSNADLLSITQTNVSWSRVGVVYTVNRKIEVWLGTVSASPGTGLTFAYTGGGTSVFSGGQISQWTDLTGVADVAPTGASNTNTATATASITPTAGAHVLLIAVVSRTGSISSGPDNSFADYPSTIGVTSNRTAYRIVSSASGSYQTTWTYGTSVAYDTVIAAFVGNSGGGGGGGGTSGGKQPWTSFGLMHDGMRRDSKSGLYLREQTLIRESRRVLRAA